MRPVKWEKRATTTPQMIEEFKRSYPDPSLSVTLLERTFGFTSSEQTHHCAQRLGLEVRLIKPSGRQKVPPVVSVESLSQREAELTTELEKVRSKKADLQIQVHTFGTGYVKISGLAEEPVIALITQARVWLDGKGAAKLRDVVGH